MSAASPVQNAFNAGELSRRLRAAWGTPIYARGLDYCENFEPLPQGPLLLRAGSEFVAKVNPDLGPAPRIIPFRLAGQQDALVVLGDAKMRVYRHDGVEGGIGGGGVLGVELMPATITNVTWPTVTGTPGYTAGPPSFFTLDENEGVRSTFTVTEDGDHRFTFESKSYTGDTLWRQFTLDIGTTQGGSNIRHLSYTTSGDWQSQSTLTINLAAGTYHITVKRGSAVYLAPCSFRNFTMRKIGSSAAIVSPWTQEQINDVQFASETGKDRMILVHPAVEPRILTCVDGNQNWTLETLTQVMTAAGTQASKPAEWTGTNWPGVIEIHKGRTWWSGTPTERNKLWASKVGKPFDFSQSAPIVASDAIIETLATKGAIDWFRGQKVMLCGTDEGEHGFTAQNGVISPIDLQSDEESAFGSAKIQAVRAGNKVLYISQNKRKVRAIGFDAAQTDGWASKDITFLAEHITKGGISDIQFGKEPHSTIVLRVGGELRLCTFDEDVVAWWRGTTRGNGIISTATTNGPEGSSVWMVVSRAAGVMLERIWLSERDDRRYLDSSVVRPYAVEPAGGGSVHDLQHLIGETVRVIVNDSLAGDFQVNEFGYCLLPEFEAGAEVVVGIPYLGKSVSLPKNTKGGKVRAPKVGVMLEDSALPKVNGVRPPERDPGLSWDEATGRCSGKVEVGGKLGYDAEGKVTIEQDLPFRTEILALFENTNTNDL